MYRFPGRLAIFLTMTLIMSGVLSAQTNTMTNTLWETSFTSSHSYPSPQRDVHLQCVFQSPTGTEYVVDGFWNGDRTYVVRFCPPVAGNWTYRTVCNDTLNNGLHNRNGGIQVLPYTGDNPLYAHGWLKISDDNRYLVHQDGTPFFYLAETAWEISWKSVISDVHAFLSDRKQKGFTALQMCTISHLHIGDNGMQNRSGNDAFLDTDPMKPNPAFYRYVDSVISFANDNGMVVAMTPLWAYYSVLHGRPGTARLLTIEESLEHARYVAARYAGHHVVWIVAGDQAYSDSAAHAFWPTFARALQEAGGRRHLTTMHTCGSTGSFTFYENTEDWLDFHMFQSGHAVSADPWVLAQQGIAKRPVKPVLNGEPCYEDINANLFDPDTTRWFRMTAAMIRNARYQSLLEGAVVGTAYGASGIYQWNVPEIPEVPHDPRQYVMDAMNFPGSGHMLHLRNLCERFRWYDWQPRPELALERSPGERLCFAFLGDTVLAYAPIEGARVLIKLPKPYRDFVIERWDPVTGLHVGNDAINLAVETDTLVLDSPPGDDVFFVAYPGTALDASDLDEAGLHLSTFYLMNAAYLSIQSVQPGTLHIQWFDRIGRELSRTSHPIQSGRNTISLPPRGAGLYLYQARFEGDHGKTEYRTGRLLVPAE